MSAGKITAPKPAALGDKLGGADRQRLSAARVAGKKDVTVMVVAAKGKESQARQELAAMGARVRYAQPRLGYLSARLAVDKVYQAVALTSVLGVDLDELVPLPEDRPQVATALKGNLTAPDATTPEVNPFMPTSETGSNAFRTQHRAWDGRGVTIGILDTGVDLRHPALARTTTGERKIVDTFTATDPVWEGAELDGDASWLTMRQDATGPTFGPFGGSTWKLPAGTYKISTFDEAKTLLPGCTICGDVNRDGDTTDRFGVLYDPVSHDVRVDSDDDKDFTNNPPMRPYRDRYQVGTFGADKPFTDVTEELPFTVDFRLNQEVPNGDLPAEHLDVVDIGLPSGPHGSHVAGITAANGMFGGKMDGQAPGAKLVAARACGYGAGCSSAALTDGMAELAANRGVDIINLSIGGLGALNDGDNARTELYNRIIHDLGVQIVSSAGNSGNALNTIGDPSVATDVVSVGASISRATWKANYGSDVTFDKGMLTFSSGGPREDGGFKPNITAPGSAISTIPTWLPGSAVPEAGYGLPAGYAMYNGTSMASPQATGALALLLSAAKQTGLAVRTPAALRQAVYSSANYNDGVPAFLQGNGQVNVPAAWELFKQGLEPAAFVVQAPVCNEMWTLLKRTTGAGLYNRCAPDQGGAVVGQKRTYPITVTRTSGPRSTGPYRLSLQGNDGTYSLGASAVRLPLGQAVTVAVTTTPAEGAHSAVLRLDAVQTPGQDVEVMLAVVASATPAASGFGTTVTSTVGRNQTKRYYLTVPAGADALQVQLSGVAQGSQTRFLTFHPYGVPLESASSLACYTNLPLAGCDPTSRTYQAPQPGIWELLVESRRTSPLQDNPFTITASSVGLTVTPPTQTLNSVTTGQPAPVAFTVHNDFAAVRARTSGGPLGSARSERPSIADGTDLVRTVQVPASAQRLDVTIGAPDDTAADLDLSVTGPSGTQSSESYGADETVSYTSPVPGTYTVTVTGYHIPTGNTRFDYRDVFYATSLGTLTMPTRPLVLTTGQTRTVQGTLTANSVPTAGRQLLGQMSVTSAAGATLGSGTVTVDQVKH